MWAKALRPKEVTRKQRGVHHGLDSQHQLAARHHLRVNDDAHLVVAVHRIFYCLLGADAVWGNSNAAAIRLQGVGLQHLQVFQGGVVILAQFTVGLHRLLGLDAHLLLQVLGVAAVSSHMKALQVAHGGHRRGELGVGHRDQGEPGQQGFGGKAQGALAAGCVGCVGGGHGVVILLRLMRC